MSDRPCYVTVNYLFAAYLQTVEAGGYKIVRVEKIRPGKAKFFFDISEESAEKLKLQFHNSACSEFERHRKYTIDLSYVLPFCLFTWLYLFDSVPSFGGTYGKSVQQEAQRHSELSEVISFSEISCNETKVFESKRSVF